MAPTSGHSSSAEDHLGNIYSNGWNDDTIFEVYNVPANSLTRLADAPDIPGNAHSTLVVVSDDAPPPTCQLDIDLAYQNGLEITVTVETPERAFLNVWVVYMNKIVPVMRGVRLPPGDDPREIPIVLNGFPQVGKVAVLGTLVSTDRSKGILCSDLGTVDTGAGAAELLDEFEIDRLMKQFKDMIQ